VAAARAGKAVGLDRGVPELAAEAAVAAEQLAAEDDAAADPDLARGVDEVAVAGGRAFPPLGERGEVGLVVDPERERRRVDPLAEQLDDRDVSPMQVRRDQQGAVLDVDEAGQRDGRADRAQPLGLDLVERTFGQGAERARAPSASSTSSTRRPRLSTASIAL
jgi:hypothetical protein